MKKEYLVIDAAYGSMLDFDYNEAKRCGVDGVILHAGYGSSISQKDACFDEAYQRAADAGMLIGAYWFNYFRDESDARTEAEAFHEAIGDRSFPLGLYFDYEEDTIDYMDRCGGSKEGMTDRIIAAIEHMIELGHEKVRFYTNPNCFNGAHGAEALEGYRLEPYGFWMAKFDRTPEDVGVYNGVTVVGKQWGNNDMKPDNIAWIPNIDVSTFYLDDIEEAQTESTAGWTRQQAERTVSGLYEGVLHRGYGEGENEGLVQGLVGDMTRVQAFDSVRESDEYRKKQLIIDCYRFMRGCDPSPDELNAWLGDDEENIKNNILYSEEFNTRYGV